MGTYKVRPDGKAPEGLKAGDQVVTGGGTYTIDKVNSDGTYSSSKTSDATTKTYSGGYTSLGSGSSGSSGKSSGGGINGSGITDYGQYLNQYIDKNTGEFGGSLSIAEMQSLLSDYQDKLAANPQYADMKNAYTGLTANQLTSLMQNYINKNQYNPYIQESQGYMEQARNMVNNLSSQIQNAKAFSYDPQTDDLFKIYQNLYKKQSEDARDDTLAEYSAQTGGLASSWALAAAQQAQNNKMAELDAMIPQLEAAAYNRYAGDLSRTQNLLNSAISLYGDDISYLTNMLNGNSNLQNWMQGTELEKQSLAQKQAQWEAEMELEKQNQAQNMAYKWASLNKSSGGNGSSSSSDEDSEKIEAAKLALMNTDDPMAWLSEPDNYNALGVKDYEIIRKWILDNAGRWGINKSELSGYGI